MTKQAKWDSLPMPTQEQLTAASEWLSQQPTDEYVAGYFIETSDGPSEEDWCYEHAQEEATKHPGEDTCISRNDGDTDCSSWCANEKCGRRLRASLTTYGVDSELGITEEDPMDVELDVVGLLETDLAMSHDDTRYRLWFYHYERLRRAVEQNGLQ